MTQDNNTNTGVPADESGKVTPEGVAKLKERMPFADLSAFELNPAVQDFASLLTVQDMCRFVETKVGG